jgi:hypothetical protein
MNITLHLYDADMFESYEEAVLFNLYYTTVLHAEYESLESNHFMDVVRSVVFASKLGNPIVIVESENIIVGVFHPGSKTPF